jgi:3-oxoacyl-[acyl-carrier protein] reductase
MRNVIVTGGSRGLGLGITRTLTAAGYRVIVVARKENDQLISLIREAEQMREPSLRFVPFDLANVQDIPHLVRGLRRDFGPLYGLVNNAAVGSAGVLATMRDPQIEQLVRINTLSPIVLTKYVVRSMMAQGCGRIVNIASIVGFTGFSGLAAYASTKAAMIGFTRSLAREVGRLGVNVNAVAPGFMETQMTESLLPEQRKQIARRSSLRHLPDIQDVADAVVFLIGEQSKSITGTVLTVDAGSTA